MIASLERSVDRSEFAVDRLGSETVEGVLVPSASAAAMLGSSFECCWVVD